MKKTDKPTSLELILQEKKILQQECAEYEDVISEQWSYISDNIGTLLYTAAGKVARTQMKRLIFPKSFTKNKSGKQDQNGDENSNGLLSNIWGSLQLALPIIWEVAQPMLLSMVVKKFKSIFTRKSK